MNTFTKINRDLEVHGLQLEKSLYQWYVIKIGDYGRGAIHAYFRYSHGDDIAKTLTIYKTSKHKELLLLLNTTIWDCKLIGG